MLYLNMKQSRSTIIKILATSKMLEFNFIVFSKSLHSQNFNTIYYITKTYYDLLYPKNLCTRVYIYISKNILYVLYNIIYYFFNLSTLSLIILDAQKI